ncbi:MAG: hypothetical protein K9L79_08320 [Methylobacter tundripaludum]|nr:hypothetical protein [Methylobacter tundripaludum]
MDFESVSRYAQSSIIRGNRKQKTGAKPMSEQPQYITDSNGQKLSVILPMADYLELLEDLEDWATIAERKDEGSIPLEGVLKEFNL